MSIFSIGAGHTKSGAGSGAIYDGFNESEITRAVASELIVQLRRRGHTVYNSTVDRAQTQRTYLEKTCRLANDSGADLAVFIHCNSSDSHMGNGCEVYTWHGEKLPCAVGICGELQRLGFRNRGIKDGSELFVIKHTTMPAILIELFFIDNKIDRALYTNHGANKIAGALLKGLI